jgi:outer membrane protein OmpA-like peptidoglycan-associated protein
MFPDSAKPGCPLPDRDHDLVPDPSDACPDKAGAPSIDPKKHGCPGLVETKNGMIVILQQVFFATGKDTILKKSFKVLDAVASVMKATPQIKKVVIEGHTDNKGKPELNRDLSERRAKSVLQYLIAHGVEATRLESHGYGPDRPVADNATEKGRALNRRTDFRIVDPPQIIAAGAAQVIQTPTALPTGKEDKSDASQAPPSAPPAPAAPAAPVTATPPAPPAATAAPTAPAIAAPPAGAPTPPPTAGKKGKKGAKAPATLGPAPAGAAAKTPKVAPAAKAPKRPGAAKAPK